MRASGPGQLGLPRTRKRAGAASCSTAGPAFAAVLSARGGAGDLDAIMVTHLQVLIHCYDLLPIAISSRHAAPPPAAGIPPARRGGPAARPGRTGAQDRTEPGHRARSGVPPSGDVPAGQVIRIGGATISLHGLRHVVADCGIRIQGGPVTIAYPGDTGPGGELLELARRCGHCCWPRPPWLSLMPAAGVTCTRRGPHSGRDRSRRGGPARPDPPRLGRPAVGRAS